MPLSLSGVVTIAKIRFEKESFWRFKGAAGERLPLQELLRLYPNIWHLDPESPLRTDLQAIYNNLPTLAQCRGLLTTPHPTETERLFHKLADSAEKIAALIEVHKLALPFSPQPLLEICKEFATAPKFKYPNLGQVLKYITKNHRGEQEHAEAYYNDKEDKLRTELCSLIDKQDLPDAQEKFFKNYLVYYDITADYMASLAAMFATDYTYTSHWGVVTRGPGFGAGIIANPYVLARGVILKGDNDKLPSLKLDYSRIDNGEALGRVGYEGCWNEEAFGAGQAQALAYDTVLKREKEGDPELADWARVEAKDEEEAEAWKAAHLLVQAPDENQPQFFQRDVVAKADAMIADFFYGEERVVTPKEGYAFTEEIIAGFKTNLTNGFQAFYNNFPESQAGITWEKIFR